MKLFWLPHSVLASDESCRCNLLQALIFPVFPHFKFRLTNAAEVLTAKNWDDLPGRYVPVK